MIELSTLIAALTLDNEQYMKSLGQSVDEGQSVVNQMGNLGGAIVFGGLATAATAIGAVGAAAWNAAETYDQAFDSIAVKTGATGKELEALQTDFKDVFIDVPADAQQVADVVGILNSRLDITGSNLSGLSGDVLRLAQITGGDAKTNAELFTRVIGDASIPTEKASAALDELFVASQKTGAPIEQLMQRMVQFGAPMRQFGFSFEDSTALLSKWEAEGVNTELVMGSLRIAAGHFADKGIDMNRGLWQTIDAIQKAKTSTDALTIATDVFGARAAVDMIDTIRSGKFDIDDLTKALSASEGAITNTALATEDWGETWKRFTHQVTDALAPVGDKLRTAAQSGINALMDIFQRSDVQAAITKFSDFAIMVLGQIVAYIPTLIDKFFQFVSFLENNQGVVVTALAVIGIAVATWAYTMITAAAAVVLDMAPLILIIALIAAAGYLLYEAWTNNWGGIQEKVAAVWAVIQPLLQQLWDWLQINIPLALQFLSNAWTNVILPALQRFWAFLQTYIFPLLGAIANLLSAVLRVALTAIAGILQNQVIPAFQRVWDGISQKLMPVIQTLASWLSDHLRPAFDGIGSAILSVIGWVNDLAASINSIQLPDWMTPGSPTPWETGLRGVSAALQSLSRSQLPTFQAALALQPIAPTGSVDLLPRAAAVSAATPAAGGQSSSGNESLFEDLRRILTDLPNENARAIASAIAKSSRRS